jgi:hypothetical protein
VKKKTETSERALKYLLFAGSCYAAYTLEANNTGNAVGVLFGMKLLTPVKAGLVGGIVMAIGALTWGRSISPACFSNQEFSRPVSRPADGGARGSPLPDTVWVFHYSSS